MQLFKGNSIHFNSMMKRASALAIMIVITVSSVLTVSAATCNANIIYNGTKRNIQLFSRDTGDILAAAGISAKPEDLVIRSDAASGGDVNITVKSAYQVKVTVDGTVKTVTVHYGDTVADAVSKAGIIPEVNDIIAPSEDTGVSNGMNIEVSRKVNVTITADGQTKTVAVTKGSVEKALGQAGITLDSDDTVSANQSASVSEGMKLTVSRVTYQEVTTTQSIAYSNTNVNDSTLRKGVKKVKTAGENGTQTVVLRKKLIDGKAVSSEVVKTTVVEQPVNQVTSVGTKKISSAYASITSDGTVIDQSGNTVNYKKCITGRCSAYTGGGFTATGKAAAFGLVAVNPNVIPYGSKLYICSADGKTVYGYATAADTGGGLVSGRIIADLYYDTVGQCRSFGVRNMRIYIL